MERTIIANANIVNEGTIFKGHIIIEKGIIADILKSNTPYNGDLQAKIIDAEGLHLFPGIIDDQVHFREPGLTHKADLYSESKAAVAGGITSYMEMPNTIPQTTTNALLEEKHKLASEKSLANYSFYLGATNDNIDEIKNIDPVLTCGIKVFMGSSTGNMLVNDDDALSNIFKYSKVLIATHCEDESIIRRNLDIAKSTYGNNIPISFHPIIRSSEACFNSSQKAVELAKRFESRLHILHLSTEKELSLFTNAPLADKRITAEVCVHHLWFDDRQYDFFGSLIKWNPAIKGEKDKEALRNALNNGIIDVVATDHAPHTLDEKRQPYLQAPSGGPLVQHSLPAMLELFHQKIFSLETIVNKMCHAPATAFNIEKRGFIRKGYFADITLIDLNSPWIVTNDTLLYKCKWSPFENSTFRSKVIYTIVNGHIVYHNGNFFEDIKGMALRFNR